MWTNNLNKFIQKSILSLFVIGVSVSGYCYATEPVVETNAITLLESVRQNYYAQERLMSLKKRDKIDF